MMMPTHLAATLVLAFLGARFLPGWDGRAWVLAFLFGVAIDVDHFLEVPGYLRTEFAAHGFAALTPGALKGYGAGWVSILHGLLGAWLACVAAVIFETPAPAAAWLLHQGMDTLVGRGVVAFAGPLEFVILFALAALVGLLARAHVARTWPGLTLRAWVGGVLEGYVPRRRPL